MSLAHILSSIVLIFIISIFDVSTATNLTTYREVETKMSKLLTMMNYGKEYNLQQASNQSACEASCTSKPACRGYGFKNPYVYAITHEVSQLSSHRLWTEATKRTRISRTPSFAVCLPFFHVSKTPKVTLFWKTGDSFLRITKRTLPLLFRMVTTSSFTLLNSSRDRL